jgi:hypothetical protein
VSKKGVVKAKGACKVYVYTQNGKAKVMKAVAR